MTEGRETVLDELAGAMCGEHLSAEDIYMKACQISPAVGLTSVYRTLNHPVRLSTVDKFDFGDGRGRYEFAEGSNGVKHHHHLVCTGCGAILEYDDFLEEELKLVKRTEEGLSKKYGFKITGHVVQFYGSACNVSVRRHKYDRNQYRCTSRRSDESCAAGHRGQRHLHKWKK